MSWGAAPASLAGPPGVSDESTTSSRRDDRWLQKRVPVRAVRRRRRRAVHVRPPRSAAQRSARNSPHEKAKEPAVGCRLLCFSVCYFSASSDPDGTSVSHQKYARTRGVLGVECPGAITMPMGWSTTTFAFFMVSSSNIRSACGENGRRRPMNGVMPFRRCLTQPECRSAEKRMSCEIKRLRKSAPPRGQAPCGIDTDQNDPFVSECNALSGRTS